MFFFFFFFQAEDGIRDDLVTGVQTCALPIWAGAGENGDYDFDSGLGSWDEDRDRFPSSLASLADYAHGLGLKFGLWVEPGRVAMSTVGEAGLARESWLATDGGDYGQTGMAQICFTRPEARQWVTAKLFALID